MQSKDNSNKKNEKRTNDVLHLKRKKKKKNLKQRPELHFVSAYDGPQQTLRATQLFQRCECREYAPIAAPFSKVM